MATHHIYPANQLCLASVNVLCFCVLYPSRCFVVYLCTLCFLVCSNEILISLLCDLDLLRASQAELMSIPSAAQFICNVMMTFPNDIVQLTRCNMHGMRYMVVPLMKFHSCCFLYFIPMPDDVLSTHSFRCSTNVLLPQMHTSQCCSIWFLYHA